jgi:predicted transcriptional regulator
MTIQLELDEELLAKLDEAAENVKKDRTHYISDALEQTIRRQDIEDKIRRHHESYKTQPLRPEEHEVDEEQLGEVWKDL